MEKTNESMNEIVPSISQIRSFNLFNHIMKPMILNEHVIGFPGGQVNYYFS